MIKAVRNITNNQIIIDRILIWSLKIQLIIIIHLRKKTTDINEGRNFSLKIYPIKTYLLLPLF